MGGIVATGGDTLNLLAGYHSQATKEGLDVVRAVNEGGEADGVLHDVERRLEGRALVAVGTGNGGQYSPRWGGKRIRGAWAVDRPMLAVVVGQIRTHGACPSPPRGGHHHSTSDSLSGHYYSRDGVEQLLDGEVGHNEPGNECQQCEQTWTLGSGVAPAPLHRCCSLLALGELELFSLADELLLVGLAGGRRLALAEGGRHGRWMNVRCSVRATTSFSNYSTRRGK